MAPGFQQDGRLGIEHGDGHGSQQGHQPDISGTVNALRHRRAEQQIIGTEQRLPEGGCRSPGLDQLWDQGHGQGKQHQQSRGAVKDIAHIGQFGKVRPVDVVKRQGGQKKLEDQSIHLFHGIRVGHPENPQKHTDAYHDRHGDHHLSRHPEACHRIPPFFQYCHDITALFRCKEAFSEHPEVEECQKDRFGGANGNHPPAFDLPRESFCLSDTAVFSFRKGLSGLHADLPKSANLLLTFGGNFTII